MEIPLPGVEYSIHQIQLPFGVNVYLISYGFGRAQKNVLIDTGAGFYFEKLKEILEKKFNIAVKDIDKIILTHGHPEHIGALGYFLEENSSIKVMAHPGIKEVIHNIFPEDEVSRGIL